MFGWRKKQFNIRTLFLATAAVAFAIVIGQFLWLHQIATLLLLVLLSFAAAAIGMTMSGTGILFAFAILISEDCPKTRQFNLRQCRQMILYGLIGIAPFVLLVGFAKLVDVLS